MADDEGLAGSLLCPHAFRSHDLHPGSPRTYLLNRASQRRHLLLVQAQRGGDVLHVGLQGAWEGAPPTQALTQPTVSRTHTQPVYTASCDVPSLRSRVLRAIDCRCSPSSSCDKLTVELGESTGGTMLGCDDARAGRQAASQTDVMAG
jgi:hypothetical protein